MKTRGVAAETKRTEVNSFWSRLLGDQSMAALSHLEQLVTGCEIIAALDELDLLEQTTS